MGLRTLARSIAWEVGTRLRPVRDGGETKAVIERAREMAAAIRPSPLAPSAFWIDLNDQHLRALAALGIGRFKAALNHQYFNWLVVDKAHDQWQYLAGLYPEIASTPALPLHGRAAPREGGRRVHLFNPAARAIYAKHLEMLWHHTRVTVGDCPLQEPLLGEPFTITVDGQTVSQDLANSFREFSRVMPHLRGADRPVVAEIGAGYGRLAFVGLQRAKLRYWIFDVPPALAISEWYLPKALPHLKVRRWAPFGSWDEIAAEAAAADLSFFSIDQLPLVPAGSITAAAAVSSIHEMTPDTIAALMRMLGEKTQRAIYTKNWTDWTNPRDGFNFRSIDLKAPQGWRTEFDRVDDVAHSFTEKLFVRE